MSLINEALKRAKQAPVRPVVSAAADPLLQPAVKSSPDPRWMTWLIPAAAAITLLLAVTFLAIWWSHAPRAAEPLQGTPVRPNTLVAAVQTARSTAATVALQSTGSEDDSNSPSQTDAAASPQALAAQPLPQAISVAPPATAAPAAPPKAKVPPTDAPDTGGTVESETSHSEDEFAYKLQGIFYRVAKASAVIDGQTLFVGDEIGGSKVVSIDRNSVRLLRSGRSIVLKLR